MSSLTRKINRSKKRAAEKDLEEKVSLMGKMPEECLSCSAKFDKSDKSQVSSWRVVVREKQNKVNLYCPECWDRATEMLKEIRKDMEEGNV